MDNKNNKLEDFFNQSINQFDDSPSDAVWAGLQERLDNDMTIWDKVSTIIRKYFPYLILLLGLTTYHFFAQNKINSFEEKIDKYNTENTLLSNQLKACGDQSTTLISNFESTAEQLELSTAKIQNLQHDLTASNALSKTLQNRLAYNASILKTYKEQTESLKNTVTFLSTPTSQPEIISSSIANSRPVSNRTATTPDEQNRKTIIYKNNFGKPVSKYTPPLTSRLPTFSLRRPANLAPRVLLAPNALSRIIPFIDTDEKAFKSRLRGGIELKAFHSISNTSNTLNFGHTGGIRLEWVLGEKFSFTGNISHVDQEYRVSNSNNPIPIQQLLEFPEGTSFGLDVNEINVENHYFEFPIGIKFPIKTYGDNLKIYANPSVVWQFHLPQKFEFNFTSNDKYEFKNKQYFGYLGSVQMAIGLEKAIHPNIVWQLGIYGEKSLVEFGAEHQHFSAIGLTSSFLFQKSRN